MLLIHPFDSLKIYFISLCFLQSLCCYCHFYSESLEFICFYYSIAQGLTPSASLLAFLNWNWHLHYHDNNRQKELLHFLYQVKAYFTKFVHCFDLSTHCWYNLHQNYPQQVARMEALISSEEAHPMENLSTMDDS